jgi:hypothetical protein
VAAPVSTGMSRPDGPAVLIKRPEQPVDILVAILRRQGIEDEVRALDAALLLLMGLRSAGYSVVTAERRRRPH